MDELEDLGLELRYCRKAIDGLKENLHRSVCTYCQQAIPEGHVQATMEKFEKALPEIERKLVTMARERDGQMRPAREQDARRNAELRLAARTFLQKNKKLFNEVRRQYLGNPQIVLPQIPESQHEVWNEAMDIFIGSSSANEDMEDEEALYFPTKK